MDGKSKSKKKLFVRLATFLLIVFVVGGIGGVYFDQKILPYLRTNRYLSKVSFLQRMGDNVTIINRTEQITIREDDSIPVIASQASNAVVNILSIAISDKAEVKKPLGKTQPSPKSVNGTGFIVTSDGMIVTYRSAIIEKNASYTVFLNDSGQYDATLVAIDEFTNLAYLKIDAPNLSAVSFDSSSGVNAGKRVIVIANASGEYQNEYVPGIIANIDKTFTISGKALSVAEKLEGVFEIYASLKKEYIGGPAVGYNGNIVGIMGMQTIDSKDIYFVIPSNAVKQSIDLAIAGKLGDRPSLGIYYVPITKTYALVNAISTDRGALIYSSSQNQGLAVLADSVAEKAGLRINDIIIMVGNKGVNLDNPLPYLLNQYKKGDTVELTVLREEKEIKISVEL